jgi:hypothetical protein
MRATLHHRALPVVLLAALAAVALGVTHGGALLGSAQAQKTSQVCAAALGTYIVGATPAPESNGATRSGAAFPYPYYYGGLSGTIVLTGSPACGTRLAGSFSVHYRYQPPPALKVPVPQGGASRAPTILPAPISGTTVLTATGTFGADPAHPTDPGYVSVSGTVTYGRYTYGCYPVCSNAQRNGAAIVCPEAGCATPHISVTSVVPFTAVTGYLRARTGSAATLVLAFLPPPDTAAATPDATAFQALVLSGRRSGS